MTNNRRTGWHRRFTLWAVAGAFGTGTLAFLPSPVMAIEETVAVSEDKVPETVLTTARANYLDARDVKYRKQEGGKDIYQVNYTIPSNLRLQMIIDKDGRVIEQPAPAPNQPENAPKNKQRDQALADWQARVNQAAEARTRANTPPPVAAPPVGQPPLRLPDAQNAEIPASQLPPLVAREFERTAGNAREVRYYRLGTGADATYQMIYTRADGTRREMTLNEGGRELAAAAPQQLQEGGREITWDEVPPTVQKTMLPITGRDRNAKYYRQVQREGISYGAIYQERGEQMWVRVGENGGIIVNPVSARTGRAVEGEAQPAAGRVSAEQMRDRVNFVDLPKAVQDRVLRETEGAKDVVNMTHKEGNRTVHHTVWTDRDGKRHEIWLNSKGDPVAPLR